MDRTAPADAWTGFERSLRDYYGCFDVVPLEGDRPLGWQFADICAGPFRGCSISAERMHSSRAQLPEKWSDFGFILVNFGPSVTLEHYERTSTIATGDMILLDSRAPCSIIAHDLTDSICLNIDRDRLTQLARHERDIFGIPISGRTGSGGILFSIVETLLRQGHTSDPSDRTVIADITMQLAGAAVMSNGGMFQPRDKHLQVIEKMRRWTIEHIGEPWLSAQSLASEFHYSTRSLYRLFTRIGTTPHEWIWEQRLSVAHQLLSTAANPSISITELAHATGFSDGSHFSRRFRQRYGCLPSQVMEQSLRQ